MNSIVKGKAQKVLVLGSLGLIGSALINSLKESVYECIPCDVRYEEKHYYHGDIRDYNKIEDLVHSCDGVVHLAAISRIEWGERSPELCRSINVEGTRNIINACLSSKRSPWLIFASSREVYGTQQIFPVTEDCVLNPRNHYARTKLEAESLIEDACLTQNLKAFIVRFSNVYGGMYDHIDRVIPAFCLGSIYDRTLAVNGKDCIYDFTHIRDVVDGIIKVMSFLIQEKDLKRLLKIHFTTSKPTSLLNLAELIINISRSKSNINICGQRDFCVSKFYGDYSKAKSLLHWAPQVMLEDGLKSMIQEILSRSEEEHKLTFNRSINENFKSYTWLPSEI